MSKAGADIAVEGWVSEFWPVPGPLAWSGSSLLYSQVGRLGKGFRNPIFNRRARPEYDRQCEHVSDDVWISASSNTIRHS